MNLVSLGDIAEFINGKAFKPTEWETEGKKIIRIQNLNDPSKPYNCTTQKVKQKYLVYPQDLLVSWSASLGSIPILQLNNFRMAETLGCFCFERFAYKNGMLPLH